jgi:glucose-6-phosphate 1-dehydrogenase
MNKVPSLHTFICSSQLAQKYEHQYQDLPIPDAYERLLLNIIKGDKTNFVWEEEVSASWKIFDKVLDDPNIPIEDYEFGSFGPSAADELAAKYGVQWNASQYCYIPQPKCNCSPSK